MARRGRVPSGSRRPTGSPAGPGRCGREARLGVDAGVPARMAGLGAGRREPGAAVSHGRRAGRRGGRAAIVGAGAGDRGRLHAVLRPDGPGLFLSVLRRAAADAGRHGDDPVRGRAAGRDGPAAGSRRGRARGCGTSGSWPWPTRCSPTSRRPGGTAGDAGQSRLARAYARHLCRTRPGCRSVTLHVQQHLIPDPEQVREAIDDARCAAVRPLRRSDVHHTRMDRRLPVRRLLNEVRRYLAELVARRPAGLGRLLLHPGRPDGPGPDPRRRRACWRSGACWSSAWTCTTISAPTAGPSRRRSGRRSVPPGLVVLVPGPRRRPPARPGSAAWSSWRCTRVGAVQPMDGGAGLGDRGLDRAPGADRAVRVRPGDLAADALPGGDGGQRAGRVARSVPPAMAAGAGARRPRRPSPDRRPARRAGGAGGSRSRRSRPTWPCG